MQKNQPLPAASLEGISTQLRTLQDTQRRAQFLALLPLIDGLVRQRVPHEAILEALVSAGCVTTLSAMRKALYRWRTRNGPAGNNPASRSDPLPPANTAFVSQQQYAVPPAASVGSISSKADLKRLRNSPHLIDLNELAEIGRQK